MDTLQSPLVPPFHYMFDASAQSVGVGAPMSSGKYPGGTIQQSQYFSGLKQFKPAPGRGFVYGPSGNWGQHHYYKYTPVKQHSGASGILNQMDTQNAYAYKVANLGRLGAVDPQLPRGGSVMRVVGVADETATDDRTYDSGYNWQQGAGGAQQVIDARPQGDVGRPDLPGIPPPAGGGGGGGGGGDDAPNQPPFPRPPQPPLPMAVKVPVGQLVGNFIKKLTGR